jgi:hypothetical protein
MNATGASSMEASAQASSIDAITAAISREPAIWVTALLVAIVHAATAGRYDAQRNELYFLACGWHPDFSYVDQPPLVPLIAAATQMFGVSTWMLRLPATIAANYGQSAAIGVYGKADGLPPALSGHNQYWLWGPRGHDGSLAIHAGGDPERWRRGCGSLDIVGKTDNAFAMPYENSRSIFICRGLRVPIAELWDRLKR